LKFGNAAANILVICTCPSDPFVRPIGVLISMSAVSTLASLSVCFESTASNQRSMT